MIRAEPIKARPKRAQLIQYHKAERCPHCGATRSPYRGGTSNEATKPWLKEDPPMSRRTWYRKRKKAKEDSIDSWPVCRSLWTLAAQGSKGASR